MRIGFVIYEGMTALDFIGVYDPVGRLKTMGFMPDLHWDVCAIAPNVTDERGLGFIPTLFPESLSGYDVVIMPGAVEDSVRKIINSSDFMGWLSTARGCKLKISVCTGSLILGAAGFLQGKKATTHPNHYEKLEKYCDVVKQKIVDDSDVITAGGVTSGIDLGLYLCVKFAGNEAKEKIRQRMDYPLGDLI